MTGPRSLDLLEPEGAQVHTGSVSSEGQGDSRGEAMTGVAVRGNNTPAALPSVQDSGSGSITALLHLAVERGTPVAELSKLVDLHERMEARQAEKDFADAMAKFQAECPSIKKSSKADIATNGGGAYSYTYAELDEIARTINPILAKYGLSYSWDTSADEKMLTVVCTVRHKNGHAITSTFSLPVESKSAMSPQQKYAAAQTFAMRKSLSGALGLTTTEKDTDGAGVDPETISDDQAIELDDLIKETNTLPSKFFKYLKVEKLSDIRAVDYPHAKTVLLRRKDGAM